MPVFKAITGDWAKIISDSVTNRPLVPPSRARLIREKFNAVDQLREAAHYYALYSRDPSWKGLCVGLYSARETAALLIATPHLQTVRGTCKMSCMWTEDMYMYMYIILYNVHAHVVLYLFKTYNIHVHIPICVHVVMALWDVHVYNMYSVHVSYIDPLHALHD